MIKKKNRYLVTILVIISLGILLCFFNKDLIHKGGITIQMEMLLEKDIDVQIFYLTKNNNHYHEKQSVTKKIKKTDNFQNFCLVLNTSAIEGLRIDFGYYPETIYVKNIKLQKNDYSVDITDNIKNSNSNSLEKYDAGGGIRIVSHENDPMIISDIKFGVGITDTIQVDYAGLIYCIIFFTIISFTCRRFRKNWFHRIKKTYNTLKAISIAGKRGIHLPNNILHYVFILLSIFGLCQVFFTEQQSIFFKCFIAILIFLFCFVFIKPPNIFLSIPNKKIIFSFSAFLALIIEIGSIAIRNDTVFEDMRPLTVLSNLFSFVGLWIILINILSKMPTLSSRYIIVCNSFKERTFEKKYFFIIWMSILFLWIPYLLAYYPGHLSYDSTYQFLQASGYLEVNNRNPAIHTLLIKLCYKIANQFSGDANIHVAVYSIIQMLILSAIFAYSITWLKKIKNSIVLCLTTFIWFGIHPIFASYSITMWKDVLFGGFILLLTIYFAEIVFTNGKCLKKPVFVIVFGIVSILGCLFRKNGSYAIITALLFFLLTSSYHYRKKIIAFFACFIFIFFILNILIQTKYTDGSSAAISSIPLQIPLQQISRTIARDGNVSDLERQEIEKIVSLDAIKENYVPGYSDPIVSIFLPASREFLSNKSKHLKLWGGLFIKNPAIFIDAYIFQTYGFWYPLVFNRRPYIEKGYVSTPADNIHIDLGIKPQPISNFIKKALDLFYSITMLPLIALIWGIGIHLIILLYTGILFLIHGNQRLCTCLLPNLFIWITLMLSTPLWVEWRYAFPLFTSVPIIIMLSFHTTHLRSGDMKVCTG